MIQGSLLCLLLCLLAGSLLNLSGHPHWFIRSWDFPRVQIVAITWLLVICKYAMSWFVTKDQPIPDWPYWSIAIFLSGWHGFRIYPYTPLAARQSVATGSTMHAIGSVSPSRSDPDASQEIQSSSFRLVVSNVEMENDQFERWMQVMRQADPDVLVMLEPNTHWLNQVAPLLDRYEYQILHPQDNWYGMAMLSRLPFESNELRFMVQDDVPSIDARVRLENGKQIRIIAVHPRPPEPIRDNDATARDAELTLWGTELAGETTPIVIGGDLNDVAWSQTTRLFLRTTGLLDPRRGRGFFNTFHADHLWMRFPLDHVFHSKHFTLSRLQRLPHVGSDHFPMQIDLRFNPARQSEHDVMTNHSGDEEEIQTRLDRAEQSEDCLSAPTKRNANAQASRLKLLG